MALTVTIETTYHLASRANLNIGLAQCVWTSGPFIATLYDKLLYNQPIQTYHIVGISAIILCACLISTSDIILGKTKILEDGEISKFTVLMFAFVFPMITSCLIMVQKQALVVMKIKAIDFSTCFMFLIYLIFQIYGLIDFSTTQQFNFYYFIVGSLSSAMQMGAIFLAMKATQTGKPVGPI